MPDQPHQTVECLLDPPAAGGFDPTRWADLPDPFPTWRRAA